MLFEFIEEFSKYMLGLTNESDWLGKYGELLTEKELKILNIFGKKGMILKNLYIPKNNGKTSEIDIVYITQKGIFVIESKNYSGWIFGNSKDMYWIQSFPNGTKNKFYNPIKQNETHIKFLSEFLNNEIPLFSFIVFSERCELKKIIFDKNKTNVVKRDELYNSIENIWKTKSDVISENDIK